MPEKSYFTLDEKENVLSVYRQLLRNSRPVLRVEDFNRMRRLISEAVETGHYQRNKQGINPVVRNLNTALILCDRVGLERSMLISVLLFNLVVSEFLTIETVKKESLNRTACMPNRLPSKARISANCYYRSPKIYELSSS